VPQWGKGKNVQDKEGLGVEEERNAYVLNKVVRGGHLEKMKFEHCPKGGEGIG
jgi:hypothetical protein